MPSFGLDAVETSEQNIDGAMAAKLTKLGPISVIEGTKVAQKPTNPDTITRSQVLTDLESHLSMAPAKRKEGNANQKIHSIH